MVAAYIYYSNNNQNQSQKKKQNPLTCAISRQENTFSRSKTVLTRTI